MDGVLGHQFVQRRMQKPSSCSACEEIIWQDGIACQGKCVYTVLCEDGYMCVYEKLKGPSLCIDTIIMPPISSLLTTVFTACFKSVTSCDSIHFTCVCIYNSLQYECIYSIFTHRLSL